MPSFPWQKSNRARSTHSIDQQHWQHPDLPLAPNARPQPNLNRSTSVSDRQSAGYLDNRRSIAAFHGASQGLGDLPHPSASQPETPDDITRPSPVISQGLSRSQTVLRREQSNSRNTSPIYEPQQGGSPPIWSPHFVQLPTPNEQQETVYSPDTVSMTSNQHPPNTPGKSSSDSGQQVALDRFTQRRLQRLNTEQGFREQRQGGQVVLSPNQMSEQTGHHQGGAHFAPAEAQPQQPLHQQPQPHPSQQSAYQVSRSSQSNVGPLMQAQSGTSNQRSGTYQQYEQPQVHSQSQQQYSPPDSGLQRQQVDNSRPELQQSRSFTQAGPDDSQSMSSSNNGSLPTPKALRSGPGNRQSVHNGLGSRETSGLNSAQPNAQQSGFSSFHTSVVPQGQPHRGDQGQQQHQQGDARHATPQPLQLGEDMSEDDVNQLIKDHKELREKYTKVKKYYFEKEDQVKQLQNSLAHQRLSQSRTSLDDSEYTTRFNRLDGLVAQLAFSIRKSWRSIPSWLVTSVNKDAVTTGKQEMTAAGRAFISCWLVEEVFDKYFHPDLEPTLSAQLKSIQRNIRRFAPHAQTAEEEEYLTAKVVNWRLSTLEGLQEALRSPQCPANRSQLTDMLKEHLVRALSVHLQDPPPSDLEGGVHMIIELVVSIAIHLPVESRDVVVDYFMPGYSIIPDQMKPESGIPPLTVSIADDVTERASMKSAVSDITDTTESSNTHDGHSKKSRMLSALTGTGKAKSAAAQGKHAGAGGSSSSLHRPESAHGMKEDQPPRVRMAAGIGVQIRGRTVLVKAPVFST